jgi:hypothetical protein
LFCACKPDIPEVRIRIRVINVFCMVLKFLDFATKLNQFL